MMIHIAWRSISHIKEYRMPLDGVTAKCLARELNEQLAGSRVDRIYQPERTDVLLLLFGDQGGRRLIISANPSAPRIHLTRENLENPKTPPMFCMLLRKHLVGARLLEVSTPGYERIFWLRFDTVNDMGDHQEKKLVAEIMGRHSNIILLSPEDKIYDAISHVDESINRVREIMPARSYVFPPDQGKTTPPALLERLLAGQPLFSQETALLPIDQALLGTVQGFSPQLCQEVLGQAGLDPRLKPVSLTSGQDELLRQSLLPMLREIYEGHCAPALYRDLAEHGNPGNPADFHVLVLHGPWIRQPAASLSDAMDEYYQAKTHLNAFLQKRRGLSRLVANRLDHARKKLAVHESERQTGESFVQFRQYADLILSNLHQAVPGQANLLATDYNQPGLPVVEVPLQGKLTLSQNAQRYFKFYDKAKSKFENAQRLVKEDHQEIDYLESIEKALATSEDLDDLRAARQELQAAGYLVDGQPGDDSPEGQEARRDHARQQANPGRKVSRPARKGSPAASLGPRRYVSSDGMTMLSGRNNLQNDLLTLKMAQKSDIWLHAQKIPGTHVIIQANRQPVPMQTILEAAAIAAWFSRASSAMPGGPAGLSGSGGSGGSGGLKIPVDYCPASHVRKPPGARPGMVIYEHYQTVLVTPQDPRVLAQSSL
jgi:predicted ribosome quality control (RQC) complex YloA/Tae2 family protein